ncbi:C6 zinc finger domain protein [Aspergillus pseudoustus]|uniref:C6 zinc finger domain protein n=1 Tax=Aspergillus pseudoustus TaxID=1810923 RepID=A0ABR4K496_9EURO
MTGRTGDKRPAPRGTAAYPRKRAVTACQVCRARRTKCDNRKPSCSFCLKVGAVCIQSSVDLSSFDPASIKILERLNDIEGAVRACQSSLSTQRPVGGAASLDRQIQSTSTDANIDSACLLPASIESIGRWMPEMALHARLQTGVEPAIWSLLDRFFHFVHVKNPVLDEAHVRSLVARFCANGLDWSHESCLILLVLSLGATATAFDCLDGNDADSMPLARSFYRAAQKRLGLTMEGPGRVLEAQCYFLSGVNAMTFFLRDAAWKLFLHAVACCQSFQFLRAPKLNDIDTLVSLEPVVDHIGQQQSLTAEQAIYWSSWKSERELRSEIGGTDFTISPAEMAIYPLFFPTPPTTADVDDEGGDGGQLGTAQYDTSKADNQLSWYFYLSEISLRRLTSCIATGIAQFQPPNGRFLNDLARAMCIYESQAEEWVLRLPQVISLNSPPERDDICHFVLRGHLIDMYEIMYWPFVDAVINAIPNATSIDSTGWDDQLLVRSLARKGLAKHVERLWVNQPGYKHRHHGTLFLLRNCCRSALVLIAAALAVASPPDRQPGPSLAMPSGWRHAVLLALDMTRYWEDQSVDSAYLARILESAWEKVQLLDV